METVKKFDGKFLGQPDCLYPNTLTTSRPLSISQLTCVMSNRLEYGLCARIHKQNENVNKRKGSGHFKMGYHEVNTFQWLLQSLNHLFQCLGTLPQSRQVGTCQKADLLHWEGRVERHLPIGCSLTCRDGAVSRVVVKSVKVLAALRTEIKRTWNTEEESHKDSGQKGAGRAEEWREHTPVRCFRNLSFILRSRGTISMRGEKSYYLNKAPIKCDLKWMWRKFLRLALSILQCTG